MSLANGRPYLAIPGPSVMPDKVLRAMHRASPNIYEGELHDVTYSLIPDLKSVARTRHDVAIYIGNGHAAWEAALSNTLSRGDTVLVLATGRFCIGWGEMAAKIGAQVQTIDYGQQSDADLDQFEATLAADKDHRIKAVLAVHVDTSTSVKNDIAGMRARLDKLGHPALLMADCIASLGCDRFEMDAWGVDVMVAGCQKGLMTPAGMSFVFFNDKANAAQGNCVTHYWDWRPRTDPEGYWQLFDGTAPTHHLFGLRAALDMINEEGLENVWARHDQIAATLWAACEAWQSEGPLWLNIQDRAKRSVAVTSIGLGADNADALRTWTETHTGLTLGIGLGREPASGYFRVGHMGHVNAHMMMSVVGTIEAGLLALDLPHGAGALDAAARVIAQKPAKVDASPVAASHPERHPAVQRQCCD
ncbi:pyridoxal-phosphate-dependent aminotransferase family protein [Cognatiyoonia koreensis]|nr:aminotransferase class V-fold PLP-dependent enzyme [Cognatiyoonia koreensis]